MRIVIFLSNISDELSKCISGAIYTCKYVYMIWYKQSFKHTCWKNVIPTIE